MPGFFHFLTLLGLHIFAHESVDVIVLEVGLGGRLDATNVVPRPVVSGITTLDYDHVAILGPTLADIAREKAGIMRAGVPVYTIPQEPTAAAALQMAAASMHAPLAQVDAQWLDSRLHATPAAPTSIAGGAAYQRLNASLALALTEEFMRCVPPGGGLRTQPPPSRDEAVVQSATSSIPPQLCSGLADCRWPGRAHAVTAAVPGAATTAGLQLCLDGAHTAAAMLKAAQWYQQARTENTPKDVLVFNCNHGKDPLPLLAPLARMPWQGVLFAPFDFDKPSNSAVPSAEQVFQNHAQLLVEAGSMDSLEAKALLQQCSDAMGSTFGGPPGNGGAHEPPLSKAAAAAVSSGSGSSSSGALADAAGAAVAAAQGTAPQYDLRWQRVLAQVWAVLIRHPELADRILQPSIAQPDTQEAVHGTGADAQEAVHGTGADATPRPADAVVCNSVKDALACLGAMAQGELPSQPEGEGGAGGVSWDPMLGHVAASALAPAVPQLAQVSSVGATAFVSGSLYLVGNSLQHLGWSPDSDE